MAIEHHEIPFKKNVDLDQLLPQAIANREHQAARLPDYETFTMKKTYPRLVDYFYKNNIIVEDSYFNIRRMVLKFCSSHRIIISRIQLETVELNLPGHIQERIQEAEPLVTASTPPLASSPLSPRAITVDPTVASPSPLLSPPFPLLSDTPDCIEFPLSVLSGHEFMSPSYSPLSSDEEVA